MKREGAYASFSFRITVMYKYQINLAGITVTCDFRFSGTIEYFRDYSASKAAEDAPVAVLPQRDWDEMAKQGIAFNAYSEYSVFTNCCSDVLLPFDRVILHAVALRWQDKAYLICANSGVGKSTQAKTLQALRPGEFGIICGDRPVLEFCQSEPAIDVSQKPPLTPQSGFRGGEPAKPEVESVRIHPSPWNGKENWRGAEAAPLAGIILLERGEENKLSAITEQEAILPLYTHFIHTAWAPETIRSVAALETRLLRSVPLWKLVTHEVPGSTMLLLDAIFSDPQKAGNIQ